MVGITHHAPLTSTHNYLAGSAEDTVYETDMPTVGAGQQFIEQFASVRWLCPKYFRQKRFLKACIIVVGVGCVLTLIVFALSFIRQKSKANLGPRIFIANLMIVNIVHSVCSLLNDATIIDPRFRRSLGSGPMRRDWFDS